MEFILEKIHWLGMRIFAQKRGKIICTFAAVFFFLGEKRLFRGTSCTNIMFHPGMSVR